MITVTKPFLPPIDEYKKHLDGIWRRNCLTNDGPLVRELELQLKLHLGVESMLAVSSGTVALQLAIRALDLSGEVITTPYSFVATTSSLVWQGCTPVFVDIEEGTLNIDAERIEAAITDKTTAILATHIHGSPCDIESIDAIAKKHNLKVIYDAAHCFGVEYKGKSIFSYGDISTTSFHATKVFHTVEGGAVFSSDPDLIQKMSFMRNFGHAGPENFICVGINAKMSEFHAAMGLCNIERANWIIYKRRNISDLYSTFLDSVKIKGKRVFHETDDRSKYNFAYFPVFFESEQVLLRTKRVLDFNGIGTRRYFYPLLSKLNYTKRRHETPVADEVCKRVLCLPLYHTLKEEEVSWICKIINIHA